MQGLHIEFCYCGAFGIVCDRGELFSLGIYHHRTAVIMAVWVVPYPVDTYHEALVLKGAGLQENVPYTAAALWPVGDIDDGIVKE
jgi:hypothetical protein